MNCLYIDKFIKRTEGYSKFICLCLLSKKDQLIQQNILTFLFSEHKVSLIPGRNLSLLHIFDMLLHRWKERSLNLVQNFSRKSHYLYFKSNFWVNRCLTQKCDDFKQQKAFAYRLVLISQYSMKSRIIWIYDLRLSILICNMIFAIFYYGPYIVKRLFDNIDKCIFAPVVH